MEIGVYNETQCDDQQEVEAGSLAMGGSALLARLTDTQRNVVAPPAPPSEGWGE